MYEVNLIPNFEGVGAIGSRILSKGKFGTHWPG